MRSFSALASSASSAYIRLSLAFSVGDGQAHPSMRSSIGSTCPTKLCRACRTSMPAARCRTSNSPARSKSGNRPPPVAKRPRGFDGDPRLYRQRLPAQCQDRHARDPRAAATVSETPRVGRRVPELDDPNIREVPVHSWRVIYQLRGGDVFVVTLVPRRRAPRPEQVRG